MNKIIAIDCDGVLLNWEQSFDDWMAFQGFPKHASDHYDVSMNYHMNKGQCEVLVKIFNESAWMKFLKPIEGAVENVKKLADLGAEICKKTSLPSTSGVMNPKPFAELNHFIFPFAIFFVLFFPMLYLVEYELQEFRGREVATDIKIIKE